MSATDADLGPADEQVHRHDPDVWSWNESWYFSWIDLDGGPAGFFRLGLLPNQGRAMLWCYVHRDGEWLGLDESRLRYDDFDLSEGLAYDRWGLRLGWRPGTAASSFDFEVAYVGNPAADIGYSLFLDRSQRAHDDAPLPGVPSAEETWSRWSERTGRALADLEYWSAFGAAVIVVTATRAMVQWGLADPFVEEVNTLVPAWESLADRVAR